MAAPAIIKIAGSHIVPIFPSKKRRLHRSNVKIYVTPDNVHIIIFRRAISLQEIAAPRQEVVSSITITPYPIELQFIFSSRTRTVSKAHIAIAVRISASQPRAIPNGTDFDVPLGF